jgi:hypothetical protein
MNDGFKVWLRPLGDSCRIRIEGLENAIWLRARLSQSFETMKEINVVEGSIYRSFQVGYSPTVTHSAFETILASIPNVRLMTGPE